MNADCLPGGLLSLVHILSHRSLTTHREVNSSTYPILQRTLGCREVS